MADLFYAAFPENAIGGNTSGEGPMDLLSDAITFILTTSTYTPNQTTHTVKADVTNELTTSGGYTVGGKVLASKTWAVSSLTTYFDAADLTWAALSQAHRNGVLFDDTPTSPADPLIGYHTNAADVNPGGNDLVYQWNNTGTPAIFSWAVA